MNEDEVKDLTTFSGKCYSKNRVDYTLGPWEVLYACVYRDFGQWRPVAEFRTKHRIIKFASQRLYDDRLDAEALADELVDELMTLLGITRTA